MRLREALDLFLYEQRFRNNSAATVKYYTDYIGDFIDWLSSEEKITEVEQLTITEYKDYVIYLSGTALKSVSVNTKVRAVKAFYNFLIDEEKIGEDWEPFGPCDYGVQLSYGDYPPEFLTSEYNDDLDILDF